MVSAHDSNRATDPGHDNSNVQTALDVMPVDDISSTLVIREQNSFLLTDLSGSVPAGQAGGLGFYLRDMRHLSQYELLL